MIRLHPVVLIALAACRVTTSPPTPPPASSAETTMSSTQHFLGLRTAAYTAPDLAAAKQWYIEVTGIEPYFDEPFYVGFNIGGYELGITPDSAAKGKRDEAGVAFWGVSNADSALARLLKLGATLREAVQDVGEGIKVATVHDPFGNVFGIIENPHFKLP